MSIAAVRSYFRPLGREQDILEFDVSSATVELTCPELEQYACNCQGWVDLCKGWQAEN